MGELKILSWKPPPGPPLGMEAWLRMPDPARRSVAVRTMGLPAGSRMRTKLIENSLRSGWELVNRGKFELAAKLYDPSCEIRYGDGRPPDVPALVTGAEGFVKFWERITSDGVHSAQFEVSEIFDAGGPCFACRIRGTVAGAFTGLEIPTLTVHAYTMNEGGLVSHQEVYYDWDMGPAALSAALGDPDGYRIELIEKG